MKICIVTDAWLPQVNGVVTTLVELQRGLLARDHEVVMIEPSGFRRFACPGYREIELAWRPGRGVPQALQQARPDAIHIATEGPMGSAAQRGPIACAKAWRSRPPSTRASRRSWRRPCAFPSAGAKPGSSTLIRPRAE